MPVFVMRWLLVLTGRRQKRTEAVLEEKPSSWQERVVHDVDGLKRYTTRFTA